VFDIIGKRRYLYIFSLLVTIPGLILILLTPFTDIGLQFSIDYTGGTRWVIRFEDRGVTPAQVESVFADAGLKATVIREANDFLDIRTEQVVGLREAPVPTPTPAASGSPSASGSPAASESPAGSAAPSTSPAPSASAAASASPSPSPTPTPTPAASESPGASASPGPSGSPEPSTPPGNSEIPTDGQLGAIAATLQDQFGPIESQTALTSIGGVVSSDLIQNTIVLIAVGSLGIMLWMTYRFRDVRFGATALVSLLHDVLVVVGVFALLGTIAGVQIDALFVTAMLTVIGFSVHDTIVVYDRVRENRARHAGEPFDEIVNHSILQTIGRSITTSMTVVITLLALLLFGGAAINNFLIALIIGIVSGTYSSIFVAAPLLVDWHLWEDRRHGRMAASRGPRVRRATP
jgi:preprotein translocase SecF subunit